MLRTCNWAALIALASLGCASALQTGPVPPALRNSSVQYFVENHGQDRHGIDRILAAKIRARGLKATHGPKGTRPPETDVLVVYEDRWQWDMRNYLIFLRVDLRDPGTNVLMATGNSYQTSAKFDSIDEVVSRIVGGMFGP